MPHAPHPAHFVRTPLHMHYMLMRILRRAGTSTAAVEGRAVRSFSHAKRWRAAPGARAARRCPMRRRRRCWRRCAPTPICSAQVCACMHAWRVNVRVHVRVRVHVSTPLAPPRYSMGMARARFVHVQGVCTPRAALPRRCAAARAARRWLVLEHVRRPSVHCRHCVRPLPGGGPPHHHAV